MSDYKIARLWSWWKLIWQWMSVKGSVCRSFLRIQTYNVAFMCCLKPMRCYQEIFGCFLNKLLKSWLHLTWQMSMAYFNQIAFEMLDLQQGLLYHIWHCFRNARLATRPFVLHMTQKSYVINISDNATTNN